MKNEKKDLRKKKNHLYSKQIRIYGMKKLGKLQSLKIFILDLKGNGIAVIKNIILVGVKKVSIYYKKEVILT